MTDTPEPTSQPPQAQRSGQPFEAFPNLAAMIEDVGWNTTGLSLIKWYQFLTEINTALTTARTEGVRDATKDGWLIWSNEHIAWWRPNSSGYTVDINQAGRYSLYDCLGRCGMRDDIKVLRGRYSVPAEIPQPSPELLASIRASSREG